MAVRTLPNEVLLREVTELVKEGHEVTILAKGYSMLPFIRHLEDSVTLKWIDKVTVGDIVLARLAGERYVLHRVIEVEDDSVTLMGDGNIRGTESCTTADICGTAVQILKKDGRQVDCRTPKALKQAARWRRLLPVRRWILAVYRRIWKLEKLER